MSINVVKNGQRRMQESADFFRPSEQSGVKNMLC